MDQSHGQDIKLDEIAINSDVIRVLKMAYDVTPGWGDEHCETVEEFFHPIDLTAEAREALFITM